MLLSVRSSFLAVVAVAALPLAAAAQVCIGVPAQVGQYHLSVGYEEQGNLTSYDAEFGGYLLSEVFAEVGGGIREISGLDERVNFARGLVGTEIARLNGGSICPTLRVSGETIGFPEYDQTTLGIGLGVSAGYLIATDWVTLLPALGAHYSIARAQQSYLDNSVTLTNTEGFFSGKAGLTFGFDRFFVTPEVGIDSIEASDAAYGLEIGFYFGG